MAFFMSDKRGTLQFLGVANLILCGFFIFFSLPFFLRQSQVLRSWPIADAQVLRSDVVSQPAAGHDQLYTAKLQILYTVGGKPITAELTSFESSNYEATQTRVREFPVGSHHPVRYDPHNPSQARIGAEWSARFFAVPLIIASMGIFFAIAALAFFLLARRFTVGQPTSPSPLP
jgi:hypothetical protein